MGDEVFRDLVIARVAEPTSLLDVGRVLTDLGREPAPYITMRRTLDRCGKDGYQDELAELCFAYAQVSGNISLVLYDVTTLYFEAEKEDGLRKVGFSKERRVDPQIVVGLLVDRAGFPLEIACFEGNKAEKHTIVPVIEAFKARHQIENMVVVADAGMLSAANLTMLDEAGHRFIVGSRVTKAPIDLESHFRWHGDAFTDGQIRIAKDTGLANLPLHGFAANQIWCAIVALAMDLTAWMQTLALTGHDVRRWEPKRLRLRLFTVPATMARTGRRVLLHLAARAPWADLVLAAILRLRALAVPG